MTNSDQIKHDIDQLLSDKTVTRDTARARLRDISDHIEILIESLTAYTGDDEDSSFVDENEMKE